MPQQLSATNLRDLATQAYKENNLSIVINSLRMARMLVLVRYGRPQQPNLAGIYRTRKRGGQL